MFLAVILKFQRSNHHLFYLIDWKISYLFIKLCVTNFYVCYSFMQVFSCDLYNKNYSKISSQYCGDSAIISVVDLFNNRDIIYSSLLPAHFHL